MKASAILLCLAHLVMLMVPTEMAADEAECAIPKDVTCFVCDSRKDSFCADPFNSTEISLSHTRPCEGECLKWEREVDPGNPDSEWYVLRLCKTDVSIEMYLSPDMCIDESRPGSGRMCTCMSERCNHSTMNLSSNFLLTLIALLLFCKNKELL